MAELKQMHTPFQITIAFAPNASLHLYQTLTLEHHTTIQALIESLGWHQQYTDFFHQYDVGIFSKKVDWDTQLTAGDRVEIYRPLTIDPMKKRKNKQKPK